MRLRLRRCRCAQVFAEGHEELSALKGAEASAMSRSWRSNEESLRRNRRPRALRGGVQGVGDREPAGAPAKAYRAFRSGGSGRFRHPDVEDVMVSSACSLGVVSGDRGARVLASKLASIFSENGAK